MGSPERPAPRPAATAAAICEGVSTTTTPAFSNAKIENFAKASSGQQKKTNSSRSILINQLTVPHWVVRVEC